jgi:TrmH family RNA methyltransferase
MGAAGVLPWERRPLSAESLEGPVFALEVGGVPLDQFNFPPRGTVILGSEEFGLGAQAEAAAKAGLGKVSIPLLGAKVSLNVSVAFGILMQAWSHAILNHPPANKPRQQ